ncbi:hypothetical protein D3C81_1770290 [compost metagenome]
MTHGDFITDNAGHLRGKGVVASKEKQADAYASCNSAPIKDLFVVDCFAQRHQHRLRHSQVVGSVENR